MAKAPQDELKRAFMRGLARSMRALDQPAVAAAPKRRPKAKPKPRRAAKQVAKPKQKAARAKARR